MSRTDSAGKSAGGSMKVILKQDVENVGRKGDIITVAPGYGRNYLLPRKLAIEVTPSNVKMIEIERQALKKIIEKERLSFKDHIFGSVSATDIQTALAEQGIEIDKKKIVLSEPLKRLGNYTVPIKVYHDDKAEIKVAVIREEEVKTEEENREEPK
jgi:large subunit ribosomal protein L9